VQRNHVSDGLGKAARPSSTPVSSVPDSEDEDEHEGRGRHRERDHSQPQIALFAAPYLIPPSYPGVLLVPSLYRRLKAIMPAAYARRAAAGSKDHTEGLRAVSQKRNLPWAKSTEYLEWAAGPPLVFGFPGIRQISPDARSEGPEAEEGSQGWDYFH
jgi:hypothetical protein